MEAKVISFSTVIHAFAREGDATTAALWQEKMLKMGIEPVPSRIFIHFASF